MILQPAQSKAIKSFFMEYLTFREWRKAVGWQCKLITRPWPHQFFSDNLNRFAAFFDDKTGN